MKQRSTAALADAPFIEEHLENARVGKPARATSWALDASHWLDVEVRWTDCETGDDAHTLESRLVELLMAHGIWNRASSRAAETLGRRRALLVPIDSDDGVESITVAQLTYDDGGKAVRRILREAFPDRVHGSS